MDNKLDKLTACPDCDLLVEQVEIVSNQQAHCPRCNATLYQGKSNSVTKTLVVSGSGLLMVIPAYTLPIMEMKILGLSNSTSVLGTIPIMLDASLWLSGLGVLLFAIVFPILILGLSFWISMHLSLKMYPPNLKMLQRFFQSLTHWAMPEVYLLGILISYIKLQDDFQLTADIGMVSFILLMFCSLLVTMTVSRQHFWEAIRRDATARIS